MTEVAHFLLIFSLQICVFFGVPYWLWRRLKHGRPSTTSLPITEDGAGGWSVPALATFVGIRGLPWIAVATNSLNPRLTITDDGITYRVLRTRTHSFAEVEQVDVRVFGATVVLSFAFQGSPFTFDANVGSVALAASVLAILPQEVPRTTSATEVVATVGSQPQDN